MQIQQNIWSVTYAFVMLEAPIKNLEQEWTKPGLQITGERRNNGNTGTIGISRKGNGPAAQPYCRTGDGGRKR